MPSSTTPRASSPTRTSPCSTPSCAKKRSRSSTRPTAMATAAGGPPSTSEQLDLQQDDRVDDEQDREEDGGAVKIALDHRAAAEGAAPAADAEGAGEAGVFPGVQQDQEDQDPADDHLKDSEQRVHEGECSCCRPAANRRIPAS